MSDSDRAAAFELLKTATLIDFEVVETEVGDIAPEGSMKAFLQFTEPEAVEWGGLAFLFAVAAISFMEARPAGNSAIAYAGTTTSSGWATWSSGSDSSAGTCTCTPTTCAGDS